MRRTRQGVALITAMFFGILCLGMAVGFLTLSPHDLTGTSQRATELQATYAADAGMQDTMAWIGHTLNSGAEPCTISDPEPLRTGSSGNWTWECQVVADSGTPPNGSSNLRLYELTCTAFDSDGTPRYRIRADVQGGQSFSRFSMFIDEDTPGLWDFIVSPHTKMKGPIHKNRSIRLYVQSGFYAGAPYSQTPFDGEVSTTESAFVWSSGGNPDSNGGAWDSVFSGGLGDVQYNSAPKPLPGDSSILARAAFGSALPPSPPPGVTVNPAGGVYIDGDVDDMQMSVDGSGRFQVVIVQGGQTTTVVEDTGTDQRIVTFPDGTVQNVAGRGTGVIFASGSINSLAGTNKGDHTIAVDFEVGSDIEVTGAILRDDTTPGNEPSVTDDRLGLVAEHLYIAPDSVLPRNVSNPLYLYATILATERFEVRNPTSGPPGALVIHGGLSGRTTWRVGNFNTATSQMIHGYGGLNGFGTPHLYYDALLANEPPPEYPTTGPSELFIRSWTENPL